MPRTPQHDRLPNLSHEFMVNEERELELSDIAASIQKIGKSLQDRGFLTLKSGEKEVEVRPPGRCKWLLRYERLPRGELKLKFELEWEENQPRLLSSDDKWDIVE